MTATDEWLKSLGKVAGAQTALGLSLDDRKPDALAEQQRLGQELGLPPAVVASDPEGFRARAERERNARLLADAPLTAKWLADRNNGGLAKDDIENLSWFEKNVVRSQGALTRAVGRGVIRTEAMLPVLQAEMTGSFAGDIGKSVDQLYAEELARFPGSEGNPTIQADARRKAQIRFDALDGMSAENQTAMLAAGGRNLQAAREALDRAGAVPMSETGGKFRDEVLDKAENTLMGVLRAFASDPIGGAAFIAETAAETLPLLLAATGATVATRSPALGIGAMAGGSFLLENSASAMEFLQEAGADLSTPEGALAVLGNADLMREATARGLSRGVVVALFDAMSGGVAGQTLMKSAAGEAVVQGIAQAAFGAGGEAAAQAVSGQEVSWKDIVVEGLAELATTPVEVIGIGGRGLIKRLSEAAKSGQTAEVLAQVDERATASKLRERDPARFKELLDQVAGDRFLYVPVDDLNTYFQAKDTTFDPADWGVDPNDFAEQLAVGGSIAIPVSAYAAKASGTPDADWFRDHAVFDPDEMSVAEAARFNEEVREVMDQAMAEADSARVADLESRASDVQVYDGLYGQLRAAGRGVDVAMNEARAMTAFFRSMAARYGDDALDLARRFGLAVAGPEQQETRRRGDMDIALNTLRRGDIGKPGQSLTDFVIARGGVRDMGGDLEAIGVPKGVIAETRAEYIERSNSPSMLGLPAEAKGDTLDNIARRAVEAGYFPDLAGKESELEGDLARVVMEALAEEVAGRKTYVPGDGPDADLVRLGEELSARGIDINAMTNDEIMAAKDAPVDGDTYNQDGTLKTDTPAFREWFGDSKVVDAEGRPLVVYHGTATDFEAFDTRASRRSIDTGQALGSWFASSPEAAGIFGAEKSESGQNLKPVYLRIENPFEVMAYRDLVVMAWRFDGRFASLRQSLIKKGHDGIVLRGSTTDGGPVRDDYVAFDPTQIKSIFNRGTFDGSDPRILYQGEAQAEPLYVVHNLSEEKLRHATDLGGLAAPSLAVARGDIGFDGFGEISLIGDPAMADPKGKGVRAFNADVYSPRQPRARFKIKERDAQKVFAAVRKIEDELGFRGRLDIDDLERSGLSSVEASASIKAAWLKSLGEDIPVQYDDPAPAPVPVAGFEAFTSTEARDLWNDPEFEAAWVQSKRDIIAARAGSNPEAAAKMEARLFNPDGSPNDDMLTDTAATVARRNRDIAAYVPSERGDVSEYRTAVAIDAAVAGREEAYNAWVAENFGDAIGGKFFEDAGGRRRDYVMANIVKEMTRALRNGENWNYGAGNVRAAVAPEFRTMAEVKAARGQITDRASMDALKDEVNNELFALADKFAPFAGSEGQRFGWADTFSEFMRDVAKGPRAVAEWPWSGQVPNELMAEAGAFLDKLKTLPTEYFEIKMQRAMGLNEFKVALVPEKASAQTVKTLEDAGLEVVRYGAEGRKAALQSVGERVFFQPGDAAEKRGSITFPSGGLDQGQSLIRLFENADLSTVWHEFGHYSLEVFTALASDPAAPQAMRDDLAVIREYLKADGAKYSVDQHETWARSFEAYVMEGKAPSLGLADTFARMKAWLTRIYQTVRGLNVKLTPEVREVMDRLLATDAEIAEARAAQGMNPLFTDQAAAGMSPEAFQTYQRMAQRATEQASAALLAKTMEKVRREKQAWWKAERKAVMAEVTGRINSQREYRLIEMLANGQWLGDTARDIPDIQIDRQELVDAFGSGVLQELSRARIGGKRAIYAEGGASMMEVADLFGFTGPKEMITVLQNTGKRKAAIIAETDRIMADRYGDPFTDGTIEQEAMDAIHSDQQAKTVAAEVRQLAKRAGLPVRNLTSQVFRQRARMMISRMTVGEATRPDAFLGAERRAAKRAEDAFARVARGGGKDALVAATRHKEQQLLNHYLYLESRDLTKMVESGRERMQAYGKASVRKKLEGGYIEQIDGLLDQYDFRVRGARQIARAESLAAFVQRMTDEGRGGDIAIDPRLIEQAQRKHYTRLSVDELRGLFDTIENIDHLGRFKQKLINARRKRELDASVEAVAGLVRQNLGTGKAKQKSVTRDTFNLLFTMDTMLVELDGFDEMGRAYDELKADIDAGASLEQKMQVELSGKLDDLFKVYSAKELRQMQKPRDIPGANGRLWSKVEVLAVALNMGNADNRQRLFDKSAHESNRLTPEQADALMATMDRRDWEFVQSMWDAINSYWPELSAVSERRTGVKLKKVEAVPVETPFGTFAGGYYPIKYDAELSGASAKDESTAWDRFLSSGWGAKAEVKSGMTKAREASSGGRTLKLDLSPAFTHLKDTVRLIALSEAVDNTYRILNDRRTVQAFLDAGRQSELEVMNLWLKDVAQGPVQHTDVLNRFARIVKNNFTLSRLAFNMKTVALQVTGLAQSAAVIGKMNLLKGMMDYRRRPQELAAEVMAKSPFMAERRTSFQKDIYDFANDVELSTPLASGWQKAKRNISQAGFYPMTVVQFYAVDLPTWLGAYRAGIKRFKDDAKAVQFADRMVARSADSGLMADRSAISRGTLSKGVQQADFVRIFTTLGGYMIAKLNRGYIAVARGKKDIAEAQTARDKILAATEAATNLTLLYVVEGALMALMYALVYGGDDDEKEPEDYAAFIAKEAAMSVVAGIPLVRDAATAFDGFGAGGVLGSVLELPARNWTQLMQGEVDSAMMRSMADAVGTITGLPSTAFMRALEQGLSEDGPSLAEGLFGANPIGR